MSGYNVNVAMSGYVGPPDPEREAVYRYEAIIRQTIELASQRRFTEAIELVEKAVAQDPDSIPLHQLLVRLYGDTKRTAQSQQAILRLHELGFKGAEFSVMLGMVLLKKRQFSEAILCYREAKVLGAPPEKFHLALAEALLRTGRLVEAESMLENLKECEHLERSRVFANLSRIRLQQKRYQEAVNYLLEAMRAKPFKTTVFYLMGLALLRKGDQEGAVRAFEEYSKREPRWAAPYRYLERLAREAGDDAKADEYNLKAREVLENRRLWRLEKQKLASQ